MSKQTAVEFLFKHLEGVRIIDGYEFIKLQQVFEKAKEIEREQIIEAHGIKREHDIQNGVDFWRIKHGEQYYNETYKGGEQ